MNKSLVVDCNPDVQILVREMHENQVARPQCAARDWRARLHLFLRGSRQSNAGAAHGVDHEAAAVESAGRSAAPPVWLAEHGFGAVDDPVPPIASRPVSGRPGTGRRGTGGECQGQTDDLNGFEHAAALILGGVARFYESWPGLQ
jgi:hypothetical protein